MCWFWHLWINVSRHYFLSLRNSGPFTKYIRECAYCGLVEEKTVYDNPNVPTEYHYKEKHDCKRSS